jgi:hypothetical protein
MGLLVHVAVEAAVEVEVDAVEAELVFGDAVAAVTPARIATPIDGLLVGVGVPAWRVQVPRMFAWPSAGSEPV